MSGDSMSDKPDETVDAPDWKSTVTYVLLTVLLLAVVFGVFYGVDALYYGE
jgi:predicted secreted protein